MTITLTSDIEKAVIQRAKEQGKSPEALVLGLLRENLLGAAVPGEASFEPRDEWEEMLLSVGKPCGVSPSNEALSSEGLYD